jgi:hypothetical protein
MVPVLGAQGLGEFEIRLRTRRSPQGNGALKLRYGRRHVALVPHLSQRKIEVVLRGARQRVGIIRRHSAVVRSVIVLMMLRQCGQQVARRRPPLNPVVRHHHMHDVLRAPFRHVARRAVPRIRVPACLHQRRERSGVARPADGVIMFGRLFAVWNVVRVVAGSARQFAAAFQIAGGFAHSRNGAGGFKTGFFFRPRRLVEIEYEGR